MKNKNKNKLEYVEQFRKITAIQKLPTLKEGFGDLFFDTKADNNKFIRLKDQINLNQVEINYQNVLFCSNDYVKEFCIDSQIICKNAVQTQMDILNDQINSFNQWANHLTEEIKRANFVYRFKLQKASPPVPLAKQFLNYDPLSLQMVTSPSNKAGKKKNNNNLNAQQQQTSITLLNRKKRFDFNQITNYLIGQQYKLDDLDGNSDLAKKQFQHFKQYKGIKQINQIDELKIDYDKFQYHLKNVNLNNIYKNKRVSFDNGSFMNNSNSYNEIVQEQIEANKQLEKLQHKQQINNMLFSQLLHHQQKNFKHLSVLKSKHDSNINFFRDLGIPSRNAQDYIKTILNDDQNEQLFIGEQNPFIRQKIDTCLLHYLQPNELKIEKTNLTFNDIENISMGRITSTNAHMCIRSEKVTRGQYQKLLRKMEKLYKMQHQDGKTRQNKAISTDEYVEDYRGNKNQNTQIFIHKLVDQINSMRKDSYSLSNPEKAFTLLNQRLFRDQIAKKMFMLLQELYNRVIEQLPFNYTILQIGFHIDQINGLAEEYYDKKKLIWFIMTVLEEIQKGKSLEKNIGYLQNKLRKDDEPKVVKYKGEKVIGKDKMGTKNLYYNNPIANSTNKERSISPAIRTNFYPKYSPAKVTQNKTPTKSGTGYKTTYTPRNISKSPLKSTPTNTKNFSYETSSKKTGINSTVKKAYY